MKFPLIWSISNSKKVKLLTREILAHLSLWVSFNLIHVGHSHSHRRLIHKKPCPNMKLVKSSMKEEFYLMVSHLLRPGTKEDAWHGVNDLVWVLKGPLHVYAVLPNQFMVSGDYHE